MECCNGNTLLLYETGSDRKETIMNCAGHAFLYAVLGMVSSSAVAAGLPSAEYPNRPIRLIVPQNPGGGTDLYARLVSMPLSKRLGQTVVVDNRPGAGSLIGTELVAKAVPDGYTLLTISSAIAIIPGMYKHVPFDPVRDFAPVSLLSLYPHVVVINPAVPANSIKELIALAKAKPGTLNFASAGNGTPTQLGPELFKTMAGVDMVHVPYSGGGPATTALIAGHVQINFGPIGTVLPHVKAGKLRALAVTTARRSSIVPELPTVAEAGLPGYEQSGWNGLLAPARTPPPVLKKLHDELDALLGTTEIRDRFALDGAEPGRLTAAELSAMLKHEVAKWGKVMLQAGIKPE
jgi:tripartite-type tricarboxylate transporter receptor subunit TctC